jgi:hypothetical protein
MLSRQEERAFARIADQIVADDPGFARSVRRLQARPGRVHDVVIVLAAATAALCLALALALPTVTAAALAYVTYRCRPTRPTRRLVRRRRRRG